MLRSQASGSTLHTTSFKKSKNRNRIVVVVADVEKATVKIINKLKVVC